MSDPIYNEDVRQFILDRYEELGHASREMRTLYDARTHGKFTRRHTTVVRDVIAAHLNEHFAGDTSLPDLSTWDGFNTPQRAYKAEGGHGLALTFTLSSNTVSTVGVTDGGEGYARPPTVILTDPNPFANPTDADLEAILGVVTGITVDTGGDGYTSAPTVALTVPDHLSGVQATATATVTGGAVSGVTMTENGSGYASAPTATLSGGGATTDATISASVDTGTVGSVAINDAGSGYSSSTEISSSATAPVVPTSTEGQLEDDDYIPDGWMRDSVATNATDQRNVFRIERPGRIGGWDEWETATLWNYYSV